MLNPEYIKRGYKEWMKNLDENEILRTIKSFRHKIILHRISVFLQKRKEKMMIRKFVGKKIEERKKKEAFPRKGGNYNETFQAIGSESKTYNVPTKSD